MKNFVHRLKNICLMMLSDCCIILQIKQADFCLGFILAVPSFSRKLAAMDIAVCIFYAKFCTYNDDILF